MRRHTRLSAWFAVVGVLLTLLSGCEITLPETSDSSTPPESTAPSTPVEQAVLTLVFNAEDTLSPFTTDSRANLELASLLYEGLTHVDNTLTAQNALAASLTVSDTTVTAVLRQDARFSDGSAVTAADVVKSFALAKKSKHYATLLQNVRDAAANKDGTAVVFTLAQKDIGYAACLSFPIVKADTVTNKAGKAPLGSGIYCFADKTTLIVNPHAGVTPAVTTVRLLSLTDSAAAVHALDNGTLSFLFSDLYGGTVPYTTAATTAVDIPYLIYLGINQNKTLISDAAVRQALSLAVDRSRLASEALSGYGRPAVSPFHPQWEELQQEGLALADKAADIEAAKRLLSAAGYATGLSTDVKKPRRLKVTLLVNADNSFRTATANLLKEQFAAVGITLEMDAKPFDDYRAAVKKGKFDLYLGEVRLPADGSLRSFFEKGGGTSYGIDQRGASARAYTAYRKGENTLKAFLTAFAEEQPFIPLNWQKGMAAFQRTYQQITPGVLDPYDGLANWDIA